MFGERLNFIRKKQGLTAQKMADTLSVGLRTYRHYESGHTFPSPDTLVKIADTLDVSLDYLMGRDEFMKAHAIPFDEYL